MNGKKYEEKKETSSNGKYDRRDNQRDNQRGSRRSAPNPRANNSELRLFIAKGRMDNLNKSSLIRFIEKETQQRIGNAKDVKVCEKFSFLTVNKKEAKEIVKFYESKNKRKPLVEIAAN